MEDIREELKEIKLLYKELVEKLLPVEEPTKEEKKAIEEKKRSRRRRRTDENDRVKPILPDCHKLKNTSSDIIV